MAPREKYLQLLNRTLAKFKNLEYVDITNIPVKKLTHLTISVNETIMEIGRETK